MQVQRTVWTILKILQWTQQYFSSKGVENPRLDAEVLLCAVLDKSRIQLYTNFDEPLEEQELKQYRSYVARRAAREPVAYILGHKGFLQYDFKVTQDTLIPRPETAELVDWVVNENPGAHHLLDIGTGSGCIAISLDKRLPDADVEAWDISEEALAIARTNNEELESRVLFRQRDVLSDDWEKSPSFDVIVSNPPYVTEAEKDEMEANVLDWEPALALFVPDDDPLRFYRRIVTLGRELLLPEGKLYFEINRAFGREIAYMLEMNQYRDIRVIKDIFGKDRILTANR